jgi:hypothetical protein
MFELSKEETMQLVTNCDRLKNIRHSSVNPWVFTEHGVAMLSSVLHLDKAIMINIEIMRAFSHYRAFLKEHDDLNRKIDQLDDKINQIFRYLLEKIDALHQQESERIPIGYKLIGK